MPDRSTDNGQDFRQQVIQVLEELSEELASIQKTLACIGPAGTTGTEKESTNGPTSLGTNNQK